MPRLPLSLDQTPPPSSGAAAVHGQGWLSLTHLRAIAALLLLSLACFLPGISTIPPLDRDEARFVQSTKQMLETRNFVDIRLGDEPRYKKPIGIYWLQAAAVTVAGYGAEAPIWAYRLAPLFGAVATVLLTYWATLPLFGAMAAFIAGGLMALCLDLVVEAHIAKTDAVLAATVVLAMGALARLYLWRGTARPPLLLSLTPWIGVGLGILIKGPIAPMVAALAVAALSAVDRDVRWLLRLRPVIGIVVLAAIVLPWVIAIVSISGGAFFEQSVGNDLLGKVASGAEGHDAPPGTHFLLFWVMFWPGPILAVVAAPWVVRNWRSPAVKFCLAWLVPSWLVFEAVVTKLPNYTLPLYPAIAALIGGAIAGETLSRIRWSRWVAIIPMIGAIGGAVAAGATLWWFERTVDPALVAAGFLTAALAIAAMVAGFRGGLRPAAGLAAAAAIGVYVAAFGIALPGLRTIQISPRLAQAAIRDSACAAPEIFSAGFSEASLRFLAGTGVRFGNAGDAAAFLAGGGCRVAFVDGDADAAFAARAAELKLDVTRHETVSGLNIANGRTVAIGVFTATGRGA